LLPTHASFSRVVHITCVKAQVGLSGLRIALLTFHKNTAIGTTSNITATFRSSSLHGSKHAWSLSYRTIHASFPCVASWRGNAMSRVLMKPQQLNASWILSMHASSLR
jgi:hypothetical protein